ncbi:MAG: NUDIX domain-containing protein [Caldilineaceae bacterium]
MTQTLPQQPVVTAFLRHAGKILLVRRSEAVGSYRGRWSAISGYLEDPTALGQARREIREETGLTDDQVHLIATAPPIPVPAPALGHEWLVHPFLFEIDFDGDFGSDDPAAIRLDWENREMRWVEPQELADYPTVPALDAALSACLAAEERGEAAITHD